MCWGYSSHIKILREKTAKTQLLIGPHWSTTWAKCVSDCVCVQRVCACICVCACVRACMSSYSDACSYWAPTWSKFQCSSTVGPPGGAVQQCCRSTTMGVQQGSGGENRDSSMSQKSCVRRNECVPASRLSKLRSERILFPVCLSFSSLVDECCSEIPVRLIQQCCVQRNGVAIRAAFRKMVFQYKCHNNFVFRMCSSMSINKAAFRRILFPVRLSFRSPVALMLLWMRTQ